MTAEALVQREIPESMREQAVLLYDAAFGSKFAAAIPQRNDRLRLLSTAFQLDYAFAAVQDDKLLGLAGFSTPDGSLTSGIDLASLRRTLGSFRALRAAAVFSLFERPKMPGELIMDGIAVAADARGQGIGTRLLNEITRFAGEAGYQQVRLDVIDTNARARKLYEQMGFQATKTEHFPYLRWLLGFGTATTMVRPTSN